VVTTETVIFKEHFGVTWLQEMFCKIYKMFRTVQTASSPGGTEEDAAKRTPADTANGRIYRRHIAVAHIGTGRYT
jgi:hypothetical protein